MNISSGMFYGGTPGKMAWDDLPHWGLLGSLVIVMQHFVSNESCQRRYNKTV